MSKRYWLLKSEPEAFSIDDLANKPKKTDGWDGVRNYQARNMLRDEIKKGDLAFSYHSNCKEPGIVGIMEVVKSGYPDDTCFDPNSQYFDPKSTDDNPRWYRVDVRFKKKLKTPVLLTDMKSNPELSDLALVRKGNRLSVMPVGEHEWQTILEMADEPITL